MKNFIKSYKNLAIIIGVISTIISFSKPIFIEIINIIIKNNSAYIEINERIKYLEENQRIWIKHLNKI